MQAQARSVLPPAIAALAISASLSALSLSTLLAASAPARAAETCLAAPKGAAPQGSHWYYRLERGTQRKCWRLVQKDQKGQSATAQGDTDDDADEPAAPPPARKSTARVTAPPPKAPAALITKDASDTNNTSPTTQTTQAVQWPDPPASMMQRPATPESTPVAPAQTVSDAPPAAAIAEPPVQQAAAAPDNIAPASTDDRSSMLRSILIAIAGLGLLISALFYIVSLKRRRTDVLNKAQHLNRMPTEVSATADAAPTFQPLPPMDLMPRHDDVDEAMRRFSERLKRRAA